MIPRKIHFVWIGPDLDPAGWAQRNVDEFTRLNPGYSVQVHRELPAGDPLRGLYDSAPHPSSKADILRLSVLRREGGWYFDLDYWPLRPLDEAERAWQLDGSRVFLSRQQNKVPVNNCVMACAPGAPGIEALIQSAQATAPTARTTYGPDLVSRVVGRKPRLFELASWPWFQPIRGPGAAKFYAQCLRGDPGRLRHVTDGTGGQLPFALHLWLNGHGSEIEAAFVKAKVPAVPLALVEVTHSAHPLAGAAQGLANLGFRVQRYNKEDENVLDTLDETPAVMVSWNNIRRAKLSASAARWGVPVLWAENGFWNRTQYVQLDHEGFLHWASWRRLLRGPAPEQGAARLAAVYPDGLRSFEPREGYILVLGQLSRDSQMAESEIKGPLELQNLVRQHLPAVGNPDCYFRPHPLCPQADREKNRGKILPQLEGPNATELRNNYQQTKSGVGLADALAGARFVVAINSTACNEALALGVPVLALGPHLGITAGVIRRATVATFAEDMRAMLSGWLPDGGKVRNYLEWLAARQYCARDLSEEDSLSELLTAAGVAIPKRKGARHEMQRV